MIFLSTNMFYFYFFWTIGCRVRHAPPHADINYAVEYMVLIAGPPHHGARAQGTPTSRPALMTTSLTQPGKYAFPSLALSFVPSEGGRTYGTNFYRNFFRAFMNIQGSYGCLVICIMKINNLSYKGYAWNYFNS
jgi:hypothetical protein